jgi:lysozyme family protein
MISSVDRMKIAQSILNFEARRDSKGHLKIYKLPKSDGGGKYEVGGINERYHPEEAKHLADLILAGKFSEAEDAALEIIATFTDVVSSWTKQSAIESYLRDCAFNRGARGSARILQRALGVNDDGVVGKVTRAVLEEKSKNPVGLLLEMRKAREQYERDVVGRDEDSIFWNGLVNRWNNALEFAQAFLSIEQVLAAKPADAQDVFADTKAKKQTSNLSTMTQSELIEYYSEMIPLADILPINEDMSPAQETTMISLLGSPKMPLTTTDQPERASKLVKELKVTTSVAKHVTVTGVGSVLKILEEILKEVFQVEPHLEKVLSTEGMLNVRYRKPTSGKPSTKISNHAWGTAIDFKLLGKNAPGNTKHKVPRFVSVMVPYFNSNGWYSGIGFRDSMHFEVSDDKIRAYSKDGLFKKKS